MKKNQSNKNGKGAKVQNLAHKTPGRRSQAYESDFEEWDYAYNADDLDSFMHAYESSPENCYFN